MKFSVLLPTRNRLDLLRYAVETVRRQDDGDWEIVVSDNCSDEDVGGWVRSLGDPRIRCVRTDRFVPVTENWNNALRHATGDYVVMLGDDDGLLQGYFRTARRLIEAHDRPELLYTNALLYAYPNVLPDSPRGFLRTHGAAAFFDGASEPFWLDSGTAAGLVRDAMAFRLRFDFNMQYALVSRPLIQALQARGDFYQSPYPDYYAMNALMLVARRILVVPQPLVAIGISPKSFGYYWFNDRESGGVEFLKNLPDEDVAARVRDVVLPGTNLATSWLLSMETLRLRFGEEHGLSVDYGRYRAMQVLHVLGRAVAEGHGTLAAYRRLAPMLRARERLAYGALLGAWAMPASLLPERLRRTAALLPLAQLGTYPRTSPRRIEGDFSTMLDVFERYSPAGA
jgi:glycosyltransferase involved in cell wall biosynthesis